MQAKTRSGLIISWGAEHWGKDGELISRQVSIEPPIVPQCLKPKCLIKYIKSAVFYALVAHYHEKRTAYAEANRHKDIPERYRTGEPSPKNIRQTLFAIAKLKCRR